ncbi:MAG: 3'-5' exonuclease [Gallionellaceae bacterium]|jgi:DNA polymerase III epsilon subunit family exonuclease
MLQQISTDSLPDSFIVFDLETTGLDARQHEIIEIAAIRFKKGRTAHETLQGLVKPVGSVPRRITELTGITQEMVDRDGEPIRDALEDFRTFVGDLRLVSFNAEFDMAFLQAAAKAKGLPPFNNPTSCALKLARQAWPNRKSYRLDDLASDGQFNSGTAHRAMEDARRALIVYAGATAALNTMHTPQVNAYSAPRRKATSQSKKQPSSGGGIAKGALAALIYLIKNHKE